MLEGLIHKKDDGLRSGGSTKRFREMIHVLRKNDVVSGITPLKMRKIFEELGPTFVKIGQMISMRPDFLPQEYCDELMKLQTAAKPLEFSIITEIIEKEYKCRWSQVFDSIDEKALGSASIAQVHKAVLKDGRKVVVKVQRPGIYDVMMRDIVLLKRAAELLQVVISDSQDVIDVPLILNEMWSIAKQEMDFLMEADHIDEFRHLNGEEEYIICPTVDRQLTTSRVLVMDFIEGIRFDDSEKLAANGYDVMKLGRRLGENYVKQIVEDGYFHADPHPGNIWIKDGKIAWLDLGMMGRLSARDKAALRRAILALATGDTFEMKAAVLALGVPKGHIDHARLYDDIDMLMQQYTDFDFKTLQMGVLSRQIMNVLRMHHIGIAPGLSMFARGVITIEGVMRRCCPQVSFVEIFANGLQMTFEKEFDWQDEFGKIKRAGYMAVKKTLHIPEQVSDILKMTMSGQTKVNFELTGSEEPLRRIDHMINNLIIGIISAAILLGSSIICTTQMTPKLMEIPFLGVIGYLIALILCGRLLWGIIKQK